MTLQIKGSDKTIDQIELQRSDGRHCVLIKINDKIKGAIYDDGRSYFFNGDDKSHQCKCNWKEDQNDN